MKFCPECGSKLNGGKFCSECGANLNKYVDVDAAQPFVGLPARSSEMAKSPDFKDRIRALVIRGKTDEAKKLCDDRIDFDPMYMEGYIGLVRIATNNFKEYDGDYIAEQIRIAEELFGADALSSDSEYAEYSKAYKDYYAKAEQDRQAKLQALREKIMTELKNATRLFYLATNPDGTYTIEGVKDKMLRSVTIPIGVSAIGYEAFEKCDRLTEIKFACEFMDDFFDSAENSEYKTVISECDPAVGLFKVKLESINSRAFFGCSSLTSVTIPNSVTSIGDSAFYGCSSLTSVTIPDSVTSIGDCAFYGCSRLTSITVENENTKYHSINNCIIETASKTLVAGCKNSVLPTDGSVTSIGSSAFSGCSSLTSITIPNSVTSIGSSAFSGCSSLTSITIPNSVTSIGSSAFSGCSSLTSITIPNNVTSIGNNAFRGCSSLTSITIPNSVTSIGSSAFYGCSKLTSITIPDSVTSIGSVAFDGCPIETATIPTLACDYINKSALKTVVITSGDSIGECVFSDCSSLTSVTIGNSVTSIGGCAFSGCSSLTSITIPSSVTSIGELAFWGCSSLTIYCEAVEEPDGWAEDWNGGCPVKFDS